MAEKKLAEIAFWEKVSAKGSPYMSGALTALEDFTVKKGDKIKVVAFNNEPQNEKQPVLKGHVSVEG